MKEGTQPRPDNSVPNDVDAALIGRRKKSRPTEDLTPEDAAEIVENRELAREVTGERQADQLASHGITDKEAEDAANQFLREHGSGELVDKD